MGGINLFWESRQREQNGKGKMGGARKKWGDGLELSNLRFLLKITHALRIATQEVAGFGTTFLTFVH